VTASTVIGGVLVSVAVLVWRVAPVELIGVMHALGIEARGRRRWGDRFRVQGHVLDISTEEAIAEGRRCGSYSPTYWRTRMMARAFARRLWRDNRFPGFDLEFVHVRDDDAAAREPTD
jgi:hypothetical protein